jgi:hypothetical protein
MRRNRRFGRRKVNPLDPMSGMPFILIIVVVVGLAVTVLAIMKRSD